MSSMPNTDRPTKRRVFFALWPTEAERVALKHLRPENPPRAKAVNPGKYHITLAFVGDVDEQRLGCLMAAADQISSQPFEISFDRFGYFKRPHIIYVAPSETPEPLKQLYTTLNTALMPCGFQPEKRPYLPHITLYRRAFQPLVGKPETAAIWAMSEFVLCESVPNDTGGSSYQILKRWPLVSN